MRNCPATAAGHQNDTVAPDGTTPVKWEHKVYVAGDGGEADGLEFWTPMLKLYNLSAESEKEPMVNQLICKKYAN